MKSNLASSVKKGKLSKEAADAVAARVKGTLDYSDFGSVDMVRLTSWAASLTGTGFGVCQLVMTHGGIAVMSQILRVIIQSAEHDLFRKFHGSLSLSVHCQVVEAVLEDVGLKQRIFADLEKACRPDCILSTNPSTIDISLIGKKTRAADRIVGAHFFSPAHIMPLLEIVRTDKTSPQV